MPWPAHSRHFSFGVSKNMALPLYVLERSLLLSHPLTSWLLSTFKSFAWLNYLNEDVGQSR